MKCFYHPSVDAVGSCKRCSRGLCSDCAAEREGGLACRGKHEADVDAVSSLVARSLRLNKHAWPTVLLACIIYWGIAIGAVYLLLHATDDTLKILSVVMAALMAVCAIPQTRYLVVLISQSLKAPASRR